MGAVLKSILVLSLWIGPMFTGEFSAHSVPFSPTATPTPAVICREVSGKMTSETLDFGPARKYHLHPGLYTALF